MAQKESNSIQTGFEYRTPPMSDLLHLLLKNRRPTGPVNEVWPSVYIGDASAAQDKALLLSLGITHVLNTADGPHHIDTRPSFYSDMPVRYYGVDAPDNRDFDLSPFFCPTTEFIQEALTKKGKVLVHCARGISRSATLVLAYLMLSEKLTLTEAIQEVGKHRNILPNAGFIDQLRHLDMALCMERERR